LLERCSDGLIVAGTRCKGRIRDALGEQRRSRAKQTVAPWDMLVEAGKCGVRCSRSLAQAAAAYFHTGLIEVDPIQTVAYDIVESVVQQFRGRGLLTGAQHGYPPAYTWGSRTQERPGSTGRIAYLDVQKSRLRISLCASLVEYGVERCCQQTGHECR